MIPHVLAGTIVHYNRDKSIGFIKLHEADAPSQVKGDVFFHRNDICPPHEDEWFNFSIDGGHRVEREPQKGDRVVIDYIAFPPKGPAVNNMTYSNDWYEAVKVITDRPWSECPLYRIIKDDEVIWEGYLAFLRDELQRRKDEGNSFDGYRFQWLSATSWEETYSVDLGRSSWPTITEQELERAERFELARTIMSGDRWRWRQMGLGTHCLAEDHGIARADKIGLALIGKFNSVEKAVQAWTTEMKKLPQSKNSDQSCVAAARVLGVSPLSVLTLAHYLYVYDGYYDEAIDSSTVVMWLKGHPAYTHTPFEELRENVKNWEILH